MLISLKKSLKTRLEKEFMKLQQTLAWTISENFSLIFTEISRNKNIML